MDAQGPDVARRFTESAGVTFTAAVDRAQGLWELYGFKLIPNGFFVDERGILRYMKIGGFDARNPEDVQAIEKLLAAPAGVVAASAPSRSTQSVQEALRQAEEAARREPADLDKLLTLAERRVEAKQYEQARKDFEAALERNPKSARALMGLATIHLDRGERDKALVALKRAWALEPDNWIIRKQIWAVEHPDQFYPAIHTDWQKEQIKKENAAQKSGDN